jgi:RimJ/RimL family protein N-acetyltransferase
MELETKRLTLRDFKEGDQDSMRKKINNLKVSRYLLVVPYPYTRKDADWWINHCKEKQKEKPRTSYELAITIKPNKKVVGAVGIFKVNSYSGTAEIGYWLAEDFWRQGIMTEAASKIIDFGFNKLRLRKIKLPAFAPNIASNALAKKLGFVYEGTLRKSCKAKATGKIYDENVYGLFKDEWKKARKRLR